MTLPPHPPQAGYLYTPASTSSVRPGFASRTAKLLGVLQIVLGVIFVLFQIIAIFLHAGFFFVGSGIWSGIIFIIAGAFGVVSGQRKTNCLIITFMVLSIIGAIFVTCPLVLACAGIEVDKQYYYFYEYDQHYSSRGGRLAIDSIMLILSLMEMAVAIWSSVICCKATCCLPGGHDGFSAPYNVQYVASGAPQPMVLVAPPNAQPGVVYAVPQGQMSGPFVIQQSGGGVTMVPQTMTSRPIYNPRGSGDGGVPVSNQPLLTYAQQSQPFSEDLKI